MGTTAAVFHMSGKYPWSRDLEKQLAKQGKFGLQPL